MSFSTRLKERRENLGMSRMELARKLGVTASAIANYENNVSAPKTELLYELFDALECDANYLYQDVIHVENKFAASISEWDMLHRYRELDNHGRELVDLVLNKERERILKKNPPESSEELPMELDAAARSTDCSLKNLHVNQDFDPSLLDNENDF